MGTENTLLAATLADGHTVIRPAAQEPETDDLIAFLQKMGAEVQRTYPDTVEVVGKKRLRGAEPQRRRGGKAAPRRADPGGLPAPPKAGRFPPGAGAARGRVPPGGGARGAKE